MDVLRYHLLQRDGTLWCDGAQVADNARPLEALLAGDGQRSTYQLLVLAPGQMAQLAAISPPAGIGRWPGLRPAWLLAAMRPADRVIASLSPAQMAAGIDAYGDAFGMAPAVKRALLALHACTNVTAAAAQLGISYETIREQLETARNLVGAASLPHLLSLGITASLADRVGETTAVFKQVYDLTERQTRLAGLVCNGATRQQAAQALGLSEPVVKAELAMLYAAVGVSGALPLARLLAESRVLASHTGADVHAEPHAAPSSRTLMVPLPDGRRIAASDYGPDRGDPVLVMHSSMTARPVNRVLVESLQNHGFRPISLDRPGFGDSCPIDAHGTAYFAAAADDMAQFCRQLGLGKVAVVTRGAAHVALEFRRRHPGLVQLMLITNPDPDGQSSGRSKGVMAAIKQNFRRRPWAVEAMGLIAARLSSPDRLRDNLLRMTAGIPADAIAMRDPANFMDYFRGLDALIGGHHQGFVREQVAMATMQPPLPLPDTQDVVVLMGEHDFIHDPADTRAYWQAALPDAVLTIVPEAGRFLTYSHADMIAGLLRNG